MGITLNVFWKTQEEIDLENAGVEIKTDLSKNETRAITFYHIHYIHPYLEQYCIVGSSDQEFIAKHSYEYVKDKISLQHNFQFN